MSRLIDADAIPWTDLNDNPNSKIRVLVTFADKVNRMPTIELPRWIPVSERLPDRDGRYLVTCSKIGAWVVDWNIWHCEPKPSWLWEQGITAWMPLPEPYEEGNNE